MAEAATAREKKNPQKAKKANSNLAIRLTTTAVCAPLIVLLLYKDPD